MWPWVERLRVLLLFWKTSGDHFLTPAVEFGLAEVGVGLPGVLSVRLSLIEEMNKLLKNLKEGVSRWHCG